jgi:biotin carboxyl carrier protein
VKYFVQVNSRQHEVDVVERLGELIIAVDGKPLDLSYEEVDTLGQVALLSDGKSYGVSIEGDMNKASVVIAGHLYAVEIEDERERAAHAAERAATKGGGLVKAVMPGIVVKLLVAEGDTVEAGQPLLILEAMKMQNEIGAPAAGRIKALHVREKEAVAGGAKLVTIVAAE